MILLCTIIALVGACLFFLIIKRRAILSPTLVMIYCLAFFISIMFIRIEKGFLPIPIAIRHLYNRAITPTDLYYPIVSDSFLFSEKGFTKTYLLSPTYFDYYDIGFIIKEGMTLKPELDGKIKIEFLWKDTVLSERIVTSVNAVYYIDNGKAKYTKHSLTTFEIPFQGKYNNIAIKISVLEPAQELKKSFDSNNLYVSVSSTP